MTEYMRLNQNQPTITSLPQSWAQSTLNVPLTADKLPHKTLTSPYMPSPLSICVSAFRVCTSPPAVLSIDDWLVTPASQRAVLCCVLPSPPSAPQTLTPNLVSEPLHTGGLATALICRYRRRNVFASDLIYNLALPGQRK